MKRNAENVPKKIERAKKGRPHLPYFGIQRPAVRIRSKNAESSQRNSSKLSLNTTNPLFMMAFSPL